MWQEERERANDYQRKYAKEKELNEHRREKLEESERKVDQLRDSLSR